MRPRLSPWINIPLAGDSYLANPQLQ